MLDIFCIYLQILCNILLQCNGRISTGVISCTIVSDLFYVVALCLFVFQSQQRLSNGGLELEMESEREGSVPKQVRALLRF